jgi:hypothetical protein
MYSYYSLFSCSVLVLVRLLMVEKVRYGHADFAKVTLARRFELNSVPPLSRVTEITG